MSVYYGNDPEKLKSFLLSTKLDDAQLLVQVAGMAAPQEKALAFGYVESLMENAFLALQENVKFIEGNKKLRDGLLGAMEGAVVNFVSHTGEALEEKDVSESCAKRLERYRYRAVRYAAILKSYYDHFGDAVPERIGHLAAEHEKSKLKAG